ncbi:hypothetical protein GCM10023144_10150 [Pigmentiphaga soli]|uniref:Cytochrome c domain-containing protein n=2 Tax=Pigmentiphaga soli TaxID=1007095 RepID=A0ABP8GM58_9BURK
MATTIVVVLVLLGVAACAAAWRPAIEETQSPPPADSFDQATLARGMQVAAIGDCTSCHTAPHGKPFAGGLPIGTPFGTIYSTNITPDPDTGIGKWSLEAFTRAMRRGVSRDGHLLYPAFPYPHFTHMSDDDIKAVYAYMMTRDPVHAEPPANSLRFPFGFRPLVAGWNLLFLRDGDLPAAPSPELAQDAQWLRGRYLVEGAGHCASCHTPMNAFGAEKTDQAFAGGFIDGWDVPPLNALSRTPRPWTAAQLSSYLRTGLASEHGAAAGPMLPVTRQLADLPEADAQAIAAYLLSLDPHAGAAPAPQPAAADAEAGADQGSLQRGATLFTAACASCHAEHAPMAAIGGRPSLALSTAVNADSPRNVIHLILGGIPFEGSNSAHYMPPFSTMLTDGQIADVATYLRVRVAGRPAWNGLQDTVAGIRKEGQSQ